MVIFITTCVSTEAHVSTASTAPQPNNRPPTINHRPTDRSSTDPPTTDHWTTKKCSTDPPTTDPPTSAPPTTNYRPKNKCSTDPPTTDSPTGPLMIHWSLTYRLTDPITIDYQPFDSPILFSQSHHWTNSFK